MAWGGAGGFVVRGTVGQGAAAGLPFAGIPPELQKGVDVLLADEPDHGQTDVSFSHRPAPIDTRRLTLRGLVSEQRALVAVAAVLIAVMSVTAQAGPYLTGFAINKGMSPGHGRFGVVLLAAGLYVISITISGYAQYGQVKVTGRLAARVMNRLRITVFSHLQRLSLDFYTGEKAGVIMSRMTSDIENLQQLLQDGLAQFALQGLTMVVVTVVLFTLDVKLALITVVIIVPPLVVMSLWFRTASERGYLRVRDGIANVLSDLSESLHGVRVVAAHNREQRNVLHHRDVTGDYRTANEYTGKINALYGPGTQLLGFLGQAVLLAIGGDMVIHHSLSVGALVAFFLYLNRFFQPIQLLVQQYNSYQQGKSSVSKLRSLLETEPSVSEAPDAVELGPLAGEIAFEDVSFGYDPEAPVLEHVDLRIRPGETVAFVGPTGAGKSTIAKLIVRFYDPTSGRVLIDGHDLRGVTLGSLRRQLGVVPQEPFLFAGTIRDNIGFARPGASDAQIDEAVRTVALTDLVAAMPAGLDTEVHERGQSLSSGERQQIALARAFLAHPRVLVLDEATSNLDLASEMRIEAALDALLEGRTAVLIAHRLSTAKKADRIVVVDEGRIVETGTHDELVGGGGRYSDMYATWVSESLRPDQLPA